MSVIVWAALLVALTWFVWSAIYGWLADWFRYPPQRLRRRRQRPDSSRW